MSEVGILVLAVHLVGDFPFQPSWMARQKTESYQVLLAHVGIHASLLSGSLVLLTQLSSSDVLALTAGVSALHLLVDHRRWVEPNEDWNSPMMWVWFNDQILHILSIAIVVNLL